MQNSPYRHINASRFNLIPSIVTIRIIWFVHKTSDLRFSFTKEEQTESHTDTRNRYRIQLLFHVFLNENSECSACPSSSNSAGWIWIWKQPATAQHKKIFFLKKSIYIFFSYHRVSSSGLVSNFGIFKNYYLLENFVYMYIKYNIWYKMYNMAESNTGLDVSWFFQWDKLYNIFRGYNYHNFTDFCNFFKF